MSRASRRTLIGDFHERQLLKGAGAERYQVCGWSSRESQQQRFAALTRNIPFQGGAVTDYGCGTGDLYEHLEAFGLAFEYTGLDFHSGMLSLARLSRGTTFVKIDLDAPPPTDSEYVFASGVFQFVDHERPLYYVDLVAELFARSRIGLAVNFLSALRDEENKGANELYLSPATVIDLASSLSPKWALDHSYHPGRGDMTLTILKPSDERDWCRPAFS